jgi:mannose-binding lectin
MLVYAQSSGTNTTNSGSWTPIPGLAVTLPRGVGLSVLLILNVPNPYATGNDFPGGLFGLQVNGATLAPTACFTYNEAVPVSTGRIPTTLTTVVSLNSSEDVSVVAVWSGVRGSTVHIDSPASLTAVIT